MRYLLHILLIFLFSKLSYSQNAEYTPLNSNDVKSLPYKIYSQNLIKNYVIVPPILNKEGKTIFVSIPYSNSDLMTKLIQTEQININIIDEKFSTINANKVNLKKRFKSKDFYYLTYYKNENEIILFFVQYNKFVSFTINLSTGELSNPKTIKENANYTSKILFSPDSTLFSLCYLSHKRSKLNFIVYSINNSNIEEEEAYEKIDISGNFSSQFKNTCSNQLTFPTEYFELTPDGDIYKVTSYTGYNEDEDNNYLDYIELIKIDHDDMLKKKFFLEKNEHINQSIKTSDLNYIYLATSIADKNQISYRNDYFYVNKINIKKIRITDFEEVNNKYIKLDKEFIKAGWSKKIENLFERRVENANKKGKNLNYGIQDLSPYYLKWSPADSSLNLVCHSFYYKGTIGGDASTLSEGFAIFNIDPKSTNLNWKTRISTVGMDKPGFDYFLKPNGEQYFIYKAKPEKLKLGNYLTVVNKNGVINNYQFGKENFKLFIIYGFNSLTDNYYIHFCHGSLAGNKIIKYKLFE